MSLSLLLSLLETGRDLSEDDFYESIGGAPPEPITAGEKQEFAQDPRAYREARMPDVAKIRRASLLSVLYDALTRGGYEITSTPGTPSSARMAVQVGTMLTLLVRLHELGNADQFFNLLELTDSDKSTAKTRLNTFVQDLQQTVSNGYNVIT
jgi:hypothetical protein